MPISLTYIDLQEQVADECGNRTDLLDPLSDSGLTLSPVQNAIQSAIAFWERQPFYFNEFYDAAFFTTVAAQEIYTSSTAAAIATVVNVERLRVTVGGVRFGTAARRWSYLDDISNGTTTGVPTDFAYFAQQIRLYPIPDDAYAVAVSGTKRFAALSADADANVWTQDGYDLIKAEAKLILAEEVLHDPEMAARMEVAIYGRPGSARLGIFDMLKGETTRRRRDGYTRNATGGSDGATPTERR